MHRRRCLAALVLTAGAALATREGMAQDDFPGTRPVRLVVGFAPGGPADAVARLLAQRLNASLGVPVVVENRPGASGTLAAGAVARAPADGRTLLLANSGHSGTKALYPALPYDPVADFAAVAGVAARRTWCWSRRVPASTPSRTSSRQRAPSPATSTSALAAAAPPLPPCRLSC